MMRIHRASRPQRPVPTPVLPLVLALLIGGCAAAAGGGGGGSNGFDRNLITNEEIRALIESSRRTAWEVVQSERPRWLRPQYVGGVYDRTQFASVFVDEIPRGPLTALREIPLRQIDRIRYIPGSQTGVRYGTGYPAGIIMVYTEPE